MATVVVDFLNHFQSLMFVSISAILLRAVGKDVNVEWAGGKPITVKCTCKSPRESIIRGFRTLDLKRYLAG